MAKERKTAKAKKATKAARPAKEENRLFKLFLGKRKGDK